MEKEEDAKAAPNEADLGPEVGIRRVEEVGRGIGHSESASDIDQGTEGERCGGKLMACYQTENILFLRRRMDDTSAPTAKHS